MKNWVAEGIAFDVNDFSPQHVPRSDKKFVELTMVFWHRVARGSLWRQRCLLFAHSDDIASANLVINVFGRILADIVDWTST